MSIPVNFETGKTSFSQGVSDLATENIEFAIFVSQSLVRHCTGEWGELSPEDKKENEFSLDKPLRLLSSYETKGLPKIWIITEADRSLTMVLFPNEY